MRYWEGCSDKQVQDAIANWTRAHIAASENSKLMCRHDKDFSQLCVSRMKDVETADKALWVFKDRDDLPKELKDWFFVHLKENHGCMTCWASGNPKKLHPECQEKISNYFKARSALAAYGAVNLMG